MFAVELGKILSNCIMKIIKKKARYKYIHCDVYKRGISIFIGDCESLRKWAGKFYTDPIEKDMVNAIETGCTNKEYTDYDVAARCYDSDSGQWIIHLPEFSFKYNSQQISSLSHEILHATFGLLDFIGVEYRYGGSNEPYTYLHEYFLKNALDEDGYKYVK